MIAARFTEYSRKSGKITTQVFLRESDETLANRYLDASARYLEMYQNLLGVYPYSKFALVENFWETGFGMPSFTLLGSKVIRLPFILNSSYPHEILHNWWGNSVYFDVKSGNWSEGLTAYLADHLIKEQQNQGVAYRQQSLQKYADYATRGRDFPLSEFRRRHSSATEAVGYGKALMFFHGLRRELGDALFIKGLQDFYKQFQFREASYDDWRSIFEKISGLALTNVFDQWVTRIGAPALALAKSEVTENKLGYLLTFDLVQTQPGPAYQLSIPVAVTLAGNKQTHQAQVHMTQISQQFRIELPIKPLRLDIDPEFDLFRKLAIEETPAAFTRVFGSQEMLVILPRDASPELSKAYQEFATAMIRMGPDKVTILWDDELDTLPGDQAVTLVGWENKHLENLKIASKDYNLNFDSDELTLNYKTIAHTNNSIALTIRRNNQQKTSLSFIASDVIEALPGLARKLPHYHKYSYVAFSGTEPTNHTKGRWPVAHSPMTQLFAANTQRGLLKKRIALIQQPVLFNANNMMNTIAYLAADDRKGRGFGSQGLDEAADYIAQGFSDAGLVPGGYNNSYFQIFEQKGGEPERKAVLKNVVGIIPGTNPKYCLTKAADYIARGFSEAGLVPGGDNNSYFQTFEQKGGEPERVVELKNVVGIIPGTNPKYAKQSVVIGAHYDHLGLGWPDARKDNKGRIHHGADDNASGVALLLELARVYGKKLKPERAVILVAFSAEEVGRKGSAQYLQQQNIYPADQIIGMLNLDTVGRLNNKKLLVLGANSATEWLHIFRGIGFVTGIQTAIVHQDLDASDQISFHEAGIPAVQLFSGANSDYHRPGDTADKIDPEGLVKVAKVSKEVMEYLAFREQPLTVTLHTGRNNLNRVS